MSDEMTCGKGLAKKSALPEQLAEVTGAMAEVLTAHLSSLHPGKESSWPEREAYTALADELRRIAAALTMTSDRMAAQRDLPLAEHDAAALMSATAMGAFERFVRAERELVELLQQALAEEEAMLAAMQRGEP